MRISDWSSDVCSSDLSSAIPMKLLNWSRSYASHKRLEKSCNVQWAEPIIITESAGEPVVIGTPKLNPAMRQATSSARQSPPWVEHGRASCRERVCKYVELSVVAVSLKKKKKKK